MGQCESCECPCHEDGRPRSELRPGSGSEGSEDEGGDSRRRSEAEGEGEDDGESKGEGESEGEDQGVGGGEGGRSHDQQCRQWVMRHRAIEEMGHDAKDIEAELRCADQEWKWDMRCEEEDHDDFMCLDAKYFDALQERVEAVIPKIEEKPTWGAYAEKVRKCYELHRDDPLVCSELVNRYMHFVCKDSARRCRLRRQREREAALGASTTLPCGVTLPRPPFDGGYD